MKKISPKNFRKGILHIVNGLTLEKESLFGKFLRKKISVQCCKSREEKEKKIWKKGATNDADSEKRSPGKFVKIEP